MKPTKAWAVLRDDKVYVIHLKKVDAQYVKAIFSPGSKHKWAVIPVTVTPTPDTR